LRLVDSRSAPRSSSRTTLALRLADHRPLPPRPVSASRAGRPPGSLCGPGNRRIGVGHLCIANQCLTKSCCGRQSPFRIPAGAVCGRAVGAGVGLSLDSTACGKGEPGTTEGGIQPQKPFDFNPSNSQRRLIWTVLRQRAKFAGRSTLYSILYTTRKTGNSDP